MAITSAAAMVSASGTAQATVAVTNTAIGDLWVVWALARTTVSITGISGGGATGWKSADGPWADGLSSGEAMWIGTMTATGAQTISVTYSGSVSTTTCTIVAHPFTSTLGVNAVWTVDSHNHQSNASSTTIAFPTLATTLNSELYWGHARIAGSDSSPLPSGFVANADAAGDPEMYNVSVTGSVSPTLTQTAATSQTMGAIISEVAFGNVSLICQQNAVNRASTW